MIREYDGIGMWHGCRDSYEQGVVEDKHKSS